MGINPTYILVVAGAVLIVSCWWLISRICRLAKRRRAARLGLCGKCDYPLAANICPECGCERSAGHSGRVSVGLVSRVICSLAIVLVCARVLVGGLAFVEGCQARAIAFTEGDSGTTESWIRIYKLMNWSSMTRWEVRSIVRRASRAWRQAPPVRQLAVDTLFTAYARYGSREAGSAIRDAFADRAVRHWVEVGIARSDVSYEDRLSLVLAILALPDDLVLDCDFFVLAALDGIPLDQQIEFIQDLVSTRPINTNLLYAVDVGLRQMDLNPGFDEQQRIEILGVRLLLP